MPGKAKFASAANYYATALHELGHWTGHASRLNRDLAHPFGSVGYAREELRAEIASMILGSELGIGHDPAQHAAYVGSWIEVLTKDPLEIFRAAADAEKIQRFVLGFAQTQDVQRASRQTQALGAQPSDPSPLQSAEAPLQAGDKHHLAAVLADRRPERVVLQDTHIRDVESPATSQAARRAKPAAPGEPMRAKTVLAVPFKKHHKAKALGARWDRRQQSWYVPADLDATAFARWLPAPGTPVADPPRPAQAELVQVQGQVPLAERVYLAVPYTERVLARAAGAVWDKDAKSWYAGPNADMQRLDR